MVKPEPEAGPGPETPSIASRIAKYAYTTPSPIRRAAPNVKVEVELEDENGVGQTLRASRGSAHQADDAGPSRRRTLPHSPSRTGLANGDPSPSIRRSARKPISRRLAAPSPTSSVGSDSGSSYDTYDSAEDSAADVELERPVGQRQGQTTPVRQTQSRIRSSRATRTDRSLLPEPTPIVSPATPRRQKRRTRDIGGEEQEQERTPAKKAPRGYADPEVYRHLRPLPDILAPDLDGKSASFYPRFMDEEEVADRVVVFCGINPGMKSSMLGHHFAHPTNKFWRALHYSGLTARLVPTTEDHLLPTEFNYGMTVLVDRPTAEQSELSTHEMRLNALPFTEKLLRLKPRIVCFVGKKIWDVYESVIHKSASPPAGGSVIKQEIKAEPDSPLRSLPNTPRRQPNSRTPKAKYKLPFDWTQPRPFRLPHPAEPGEAERYTYFWVVPNTSGLERTPLAEQIVLFGHLNRFKNELLAGRTREMAYREFGLDGVRQTVESLQRAAEARGIATPPGVRVKAEDDS